MAKSFTEDGAQGAGVASASAPAPGAAPGSPPSASSSGASSSAAGAPTAMNYAPGGGGGGGASFTPHSIPSANTAPQGGATPSSQPSSGGSFPSFQTAPQGGGQGSNVPTSTGGIFFDEGGAVPDDDSMGGQQQNPMDAILQRSMGSVDQVFQQMYKQYGLGGNDQQGGVQEEAANMPTVPGGQSESGVKPMQPMPGPLPPTSNPFGKRADAGGIDTDDDQESA